MADHAHFRQSVTLAQCGVRGKKRQHIWQWLSIYPIPSEAGAAELPGSVCAIFYQFRRHFGMAGDLLEDTTGEGGGGYLRLSRFSTIAFSLRNMPEG